MGGMVTGYRSGQVICGVYDVCRYLRGIGYGYICGVWHIGAYIYIVYM